MLNFFDSVSCETIIAENEAYEQVLAMVRLHYCTHYNQNHTKSTVQKNGKGCLKRTGIPESQYDSLYR